MGGKIIPGWELLQYSILLCENTIVYYPGYCADGYLDHFQVEIVMNNIALNNFIQVFWGKYDHILYEYVPWIEFIGHKIHPAFLDFATLFFKVVVALFIPPFLCENSIC